MFLHEEMYQPLDEHTKRPNRQQKYCVHNTHNVPVYGWCAYMCVLPVVPLRGTNDPKTKDAGNTYKYKIPRTSLPYMLSDPLSLRTRYRVFDMSESPTTKVPSSRNVSRLVLPNGTQGRGPCVDRRCSSGRYGRSV